MSIYATLWHLRFPRHGNAHEGCEWADVLAQGVPAHFFGMEQTIEIGPMSGKSNVLFWLSHRGIEAGDEVIEKIYQRAKASNRCLTEAEILECCTTVTRG